MFFALGPIQFAREKSLFGRGFANIRIGFWARDRFELVQELFASFRHELRQFGIVIGEIKEWRRRGKLLSLEEHWCPRHQQPQRAERFHTTGPGELMRAQTAQRVRHLIVILEEGHELVRIQPERSRAAPLLLPTEPLALTQESVLRG